MLTPLFENNLPIFNEFILICKKPVLKNITLQIKNAYETKQARHGGRAC